MKHFGSNVKMKRRVRIVLFKSGAMLLVLGALVIYGWHTQNHKLVQLLPRFVPMQYNTALGFALCGLALFSKVFNFRKAAFTFSSLVGIMGFLTLVEYLFNTSLGIDELFMQHTILVGTSHPGRMAPNTALCFLLGAASIIIPPDNLVRIRNKTFLSSLVISLSLAAAVGYFIGIEGIYGWGMLTRMALHTSIGFVVLGISLTYYYITLARELTRDTLNQLEDWWNGLALILLLFIFYLDLSIPLGVATGILYVLVVAFAWLIKSTDKRAYGFAGIATLCIAVAYLFAPVGPNAWMAAADAVLEILTLWIVAWLVVRVKHYERDIIKAKESLEVKVEERTLELQESESLFRAVFESSLIGIALVDREGYPVTFNNAFIELFGYPQEELIQMPFNELTHLDHREEDLELFGELVSGKRESFRLEKKYVKQGGDEIWADLFVSPIRNEDGSYQYSLALVSDITTRKEIDEKLNNINVELEQKVQERTQELREANKELEGFSYSVSHDLRAPLRAVNSFAKILEEDYGDKLDQEGKDTINIIKENASYMGQLIDDLLQFSRLGRQRLLFVSIDMNNMCKEVVELLGQSMELDRYKIEIKDIPEAAGDRDLVKQVMLNLVSNAIKYSSKKEKPEVIIGAETTDDNVTYYVKDNGAGFNMKYAEKMFGVFQRLHPQSDFEGTGVGLAIADRIVKLHGGKIWAESELGEGAIFYFRLT